MTPAVPTPDIDALVATVNALQRRVDELEEQLRDQRPAPSPAGPLSRRALFGLAGAGIAGAAVGTTAAPAAADSGEAMILGQPNTADDSTSLTAANETALLANGFIGLEGEGEFVGVIGIDGAIGGGGYGVVGVSDRPSGFGVFTEATGEFGIGVAGNSESFFGTIGSSDTGIGGGFASRSGPQIVLDPAVEPSVVGPPPDSNWQGALHVDALGDLYLCTVGGEPGTWTRLSQQTTVLAVPQRAVDSRDDGGRHGDGETRTIDLSGAGVPADADSATVTVSVTGTTASGYVAVYSAGAPTATPPGFATLAWTASGQTLSTTTPVAVDSGEIKIYTHRATHVIVDVVAHHQSRTPAEVVAAAGRTPQIPAIPRDRIAGARFRR